MIIFQKIKEFRYLTERVVGKLILNKIFGIVFVSVIPVLAFCFFYENFQNKEFSTGFASFKNIISGKDVAVNLVEDTAPESSASEKKSAFEGLLVPIYKNPSRIKIERLGIDLTLEKIGVESDGTMETPSSWNTGGWYIKSSKAGENGNLIINAHYDDNLGRPAAFWNLKNAGVGDKVLIVDSYGRIFLYFITNISHVGINDPDRLSVLQSNDDLSHMTLITCGGVWIPGKSTYDSRLVVTAELEGEVVKENTEKQM